MKPFNLEPALAGAKVITRVNKEVTQLHKFKTYDSQCIYGVVDESVECWNINGVYSCIGTPGSDFDLFMAPTERKEWIVRHGNHCTLYTPCYNLEAAQKFALLHNGTIHEITIIE
jgi:hypothetical protein